jgi:hypothetical protein
MWQVSELDLFLYTGVQLFEIHCVLLLLDLHLLWQLQFFGLYLCITEFMLLPGILLHSVGCSQCCLPAWLVSGNNGLKPREALSTVIDIGSEVVLQWWVHPSLTSSGWNLTTACQFSLRSPLAYQIIITIFMQDIYNYIPETNHQVVTSPDITN